jgi:hypothetical protein
MLSYFFPLYIPLFIVIVLFSTKFGVYDDKTYFMKRYQNMEFMVNEGEVKLKGELLEKYKKVKNNDLYKKFMTDIQFHGK